MKVRVTMVLILSDKPFGKNPEFLTNSDLYGTLASVVQRIPDVKGIELEHVEKLEIGKE